MTIQDFKSVRPQSISSGCGEPHLTPTRIQRLRSAGWRTPPNAVYVGRPSKWGNPFVVGRDVATSEEAVAAYRRWILDQPSLLHEVTELRGKQLMCWCSADKPCHADVLLELANAEVFR